MYEIDFYRDAKGNVPVKEYIIGLRKTANKNKNDRIRLGKIDYYLQALERYGTTAGEPFVKFIEDGIWELRPTNDRIFFFYWKDGKYILLHHFLKKTQKTPPREIEQAIRNRNDYLRRS